MTVATAALPRGGHRRERRALVPNLLLGTALFLFTEFMVFCGLISSYLVLRGRADAWPPAGQPRLPIEATAFNTVLLLLSGAAIWLAIPALVRGNRGKFIRLLSITFVLGGAFVGLQGLEWIELVSYGLTTSSSLYGSVFYTLVGCHALHVVGALGVLGLVLRRALSGRYTATQHVDVRAIRMYWTFVVAIWPPLYGLVYLW